jgi:hypothetical protein
VASAGGPVTELNTSTGALVRVISGPKYQFSPPNGGAAHSAMVMSGADLFITEADDSVTEINASTGALVRVIAGPEYAFDYPFTAVATDAGVFVANCDGDWITEFPA